MTGKELAPFALGGFIRVAEQLDDGDAIRTVSKCWRVRFMTVVSSRPTASSVEISRMRVASATESRASLYAFHPMKDVASVTMTLMGMIMRAISDIVFFLVIQNQVGGRSLKGEEVIREMIRGGKGNVNYNPGGSLRGQGGPPERSG